MQKRDVLCQAPNGTLVPDAWCEASEKPTTKQECYNDLCKGTWRVGEWTEVRYNFTYHFASLTSFKIFYRG